MSINTVAVENGSVTSVRVVELPASRKSAVQTGKPDAKSEPVQLTGKATNEIEGIKALESMFKAAVIGYARKQTTLFDAVKTCKAAGVSDEQLTQWAKEAGFSWSVQTFRNVMTNIRKENGAMLKVVAKDDRRLARNKQTPAERSVMERLHDYVLRETGSLAKARKASLALSRQFEKELKEANKA